MASSLLLSCLRPYARSAFGLGGLFFNIGTRSSSSNATTYIVRQPSPTAPREVPTPLVFLSARNWDPESAGGMEMFSSMFAEKGYTCLEIDLSPDDSGSDATLSSQALMSRFANELKAHIRLAAIPFAPVLIARSTGSLIAQTYISSNPAKALIMLSPPPSNASLPQSLLPTPLEEFNFEAKFPLAIVGTTEELVRMRRESRLAREERVALIAASKLDGQEAVGKMEQWLDDIGV